MYGDIAEVYEYEKNISSNRGNKRLSAIQRKRQRERLASSTYTRSDYSIKRAKRNFFRLCHHNNLLADSITFITLTYAHDPVYSSCGRDIALFFKKIKLKYESFGHKQISYIAVPELTKKGRYHFHLLVYNLPPRAIGDPISVRRYNRRKRKWFVEHTSTERFTRNLQRKWGKGFLDLRIATYTSAGIAGYMAKYMGKALGDRKYGITRAYNNSRNIAKVESIGGNSLDRHTLTMIYNVGGIAKDLTQFEVPFLGICEYARYQL